MAPESPLLRERNRGPGPGPDSDPENTLTFGRFDVHHSSFSPFSRSDRPLSLYPLVALCLAMLFAGALPMVAQEQIVLADPIPPEIPPSTPIELTVTYTTEPLDERLTGLGARLHWDSSQLELVEIVGVRMGDLQAQGPPETDLFNYDGDPATDTFVHLAWADLDGVWPGNGTTPTTLFRARFLTTSAYDGSTRPRISASSTAVGWRLGPTGEIFLDGFETGDLSRWSSDTGIPSSPPPGGVELPGKSFEPGDLTAQLVALGGDLPSYGALGVPLLDIDGDGAVAVGTDGLLALRHLFGFTGQALIEDALSSGATRTTPAQIQSYLVALGAALDIDLDGRRDALSDGLLLMRALVGHTGDGLIDGVLGPDAVRIDPQEILTFVEVLSDPEGNGDLDGDGLSNIDEVIGYTILVDLDGLGIDHLTERRVTSDPLSADGDFDDLSDFDERLFRTDPRQADTDFDGLDDPIEMVQYGSAPASVDSDGDSRGPEGNGVPNPLFFDGNELSIYGTSPTLADTDGDGASDFTEANQNGTPPRVAGVPRVVVELAEPVRIELDTEETQDQTQAFSSSELVGRTDSTGQSSTDSSTNQLTIGASATLTVGAEAGIPDGVSVSAEASITVSGEYSEESSTSFTEESSVETQSEYQQAREESIASGQAILGGRLASGIKVRNVGEVTFTLSNLVVTALHRDPIRRDAFRSVATLIPQLPEGSVTLGPFNGETGILQVLDDSVPVDLATSLMADPSGLYLDVAAFDLLDDSGRNFAFLAEVTNARTALITLDLGNGDVERYRVATLVERNPDGTGAGLRLGDALTEILAIPFTATPRSSSSDPEFPNGVRLLDSVRGIATDSADGRYEGCRATVPDFPADEEPFNAFWSVLSSDPELTGEPGVPFTTDFEDIVLNSSDTISLAYVHDADRDGLFRREEFLYGTADRPRDFEADGTIDATDHRRSCDFDLDQLGDHFEIRTGWMVEVEGQLAYRIFSDPTREDSDRFETAVSGVFGGDGLSDLEEFRGRDGCGPYDPRDPSQADPACGGASDSGDATDPLSPDTDRDGLDDAADDDPLAAGNAGPDLAGVMTFFDPLNGILELGGTITDPTDAIAQLRVDWGDGGAVETLPVGASPLSVGKTHQYLDNSNSGGFLVTLTATDDRGFPGEPTSTTRVLGPFVPTLASDEVVHYFFTNGSLLDLSGNGFDAMVEGRNNRALATPDRFGLSNASGGAYCLASDQGTDCAHFKVPALPIDSEMTLIVWMLRDAPEGILLGQPGYAELGWDTSNNAFRFQIDDGDHSALLSESDPPPSANSGQICDDSGVPTPDREEWRFYAVTVAYDGADTTLRLFRGADSNPDDGSFNPNLVEVDQQTLAGVQLSNPNPADPWQIGGNDSGNSDCSGTYRGRVDDVRIYPRALSQAQIQFLYDEVLLP